MAFPPSLDDATKQVHSLLNNLHNPLRLARCGADAAMLVASASMQHPDWTLDRAIYHQFDLILKQLRQVEPTYADLLHGRFWERQNVTQMVTSQRPLAQSERSFYNQQNAAIVRFTQQLLQAESEARQLDHVNRLSAHLPLASYDQLFGVEHTVNTLVDQLADAAQHQILCIKGIGGIGKTALADQAVRRFIPQATSLRNLVWITAKQTYLTEEGIHGQGGQVRLEQLFDELGSKLELAEVLRLPLAQKVEKLATPLRAEPHLVIIDNLETVEDFRSLTPLLIQLAGPTKFLLTSRQTLPALKRVGTVELGEMSRAVALRFIEHAAHAKDARLVDAERLYDLVGGNPLAIILVVSQLAVAPEKVVYEGVRLGNLPDIYTYIYREAWRMLDDVARNVLFAIQRAGDQADWHWLVTICAIPASSLQNAIQQLLALSLIQVQQDAKDRRIYAIHRLTSTFLCAEVLAWK